MACARDSRLGLGGVASVEESKRVEGQPSSLPQMPEGQGCRPLVGAGEEGGQLCEGSGEGHRRGSLVVLEGREEDKPHNYLFRCQI